MRKNDKKDRKSQFLEAPLVRYRTASLKTLSGYPWSLPEQIKPELELVAKMRTRILRIKRILIIYIEGAGTKSKLSKEAELDKRNQTRQKLYLQGDT